MAIKKSYRRLLFQVGFGISCCFFLFYLFMSFFSCGLFRNINTFHTWVSGVVYW